MSNYSAEIKSNQQIYQVDLENSAIYRDTFLDVLLAQKHLEFPDSIRLDLMNISDYVYAADRLILRSTAQDSWSRDFELKIPVLDTETWNRSKALLEKMMNFLTGDNWRLSFFERRNTLRELTIKEKLSGESKKEFFQTCMFSGGLDSFVGATNILSDNLENGTLFVSHYGGGSKGTKSYQNMLIDNMEQHFFNIFDKNDFFSFYSAAIESKIEEKEPTTRSRSFMFFAHAIALTKNESRLIIPENGFISLNIPLYHSRNGSSSTRTTHPYYLKLFQELLCVLNIDVTIYNPYQFKTKGEMLRLCKDEDFLLSNLSNTMSCSHPEQGRWNKYSNPVHCGYCIPCTIRRASIHSLNTEDLTEYRYEQYQNPIGGYTLNAIRIALNKFPKLNHSLKVHSSGPLEGDINQYTSVYERGMEELNDFMKGIN